VAAVAVPLVLRSSGPTGPTLSSLPASAILAKSLAAVRSVHSVEIVDSTTNGTQSTTETVDAGPTGGSVRSSDGGSTSDFELAGNAVYVRGAVDALVNLGVATGVAHRYVDRWVSSPAGSLPGISTVRALLEDRTWLAVLSLTHVAKFTERPLYVSVTGTMPSSALLPAGATRTKATLTISTSAPYWPQSMYFSTSGLLSTLTFSHWGRAPASTTPVGATPLAALVADSASGTAAERAILQAISLRPSDGPSGSSVQLEVDGNQVEGQVTLDLCSQRFASERFRVARRQVTLAGVGNGGMGTEAVVYANGAATATAFAELRHAAATCPDRYVVPPEGPPVWKTTLGPPPDLTWQAVSGVQRLAFDETVSIKGEPAAGGVNVYLRRGRVLLALYFDGVKRLGVPIDGLRSVEGITQMFEERWRPCRPPPWADAAPFQLRRLLWSSRGYANDARSRRAETWASNEWTDPVEEGSQYPAVAGSMAAPTTVLPVSEPWYTSLPIGRRRRWTERCHSLARWRSPPVHTVELVPTVGSPKNATPMPINRSGREGGRAVIPLRSALCGQEVRA
jgi:hypothetical protein